MKIKFLLFGILVLFVLSASAADGDEFSGDGEGDYDGDDYDEYDEGFTTEAEHSGDGEDGGNAELTPHSDDVDLKIINDNLNVTTPNSTMSSPLGRGINVNLIHLEPTLAPVITTEVFGDIDQPKCPKDCQCNDDVQFVNCSQRELTAIPNDLPSDAFIINLSHNQIDVLDVGKFENSTKVREILLNGNKIHTVTNTQAFVKLPHLDHINLASNQLQNLTGNEFNDAKQLTKLTLSHNPLKLEDGNVLVNVSDLEVLNLSGCNITELYNSTFEPNIELLSLNLNNNPLPEKFNVHAFHSLKHLKELHIPRIDQSVSLDLCNTLTGIDAINIGTYEISCFELVSGHSFEDSTATVPPTSTRGNNKPLAVASSSTTTDKVASPTTSEKVIEISTEHTNQTNGKPSDATPIVTTPAPVALDHAEVVATPENKSNNRVDISANSINNILIGIIVIALLGLTVGIICRQDCFGIKTKMCRSSRRPAATDQVRPAEEVPLNKV